MTSSPHFQAKREMLSIDNVYRDLAGNNSLLFVGPQEESILIAQYIEENYKLTVNPKLVAEIPKGNSDLLIWKFS